MLDNESLPLQELKRVTHRLARDAQPIRNLFLGQPLARSQYAFGDSVDQPTVNLLDEVGKKMKGFHRIVY
jgi:hypothetical protein